MFGVRDPGKNAGAFQQSQTLATRDVDVVSDHAAEHCAGDTADHRTLELVTARHRTNRCTCGRTDRRVTLSVLHDSPLPRRG